MDRANGLDPHRPLYRIALHDVPGTELYVSFDNRRGGARHDPRRALVELRRQRAALDLSDCATQPLGGVGPHRVGALAHCGDCAMTGAVLGIVRIRIAQRRLASPYRAGTPWHHWLGLVSAIFLLTFIFSGWLSMDHGRLFSVDKLTDAEAKAVSGTPAWDTLAPDELQHFSAQAREVECSRSEGRSTGASGSCSAFQHLFVTGASNTVDRAFLAADDVSALAPMLTSGCSAAVTIAAGDSYSIESTMPGAPVYRLVCGEVWYHIDAASGLPRSRSLTPRGGPIAGSTARCTRSISRAAGSADNAHDLDRRILCSRAGVQPERRRDRMASIAHRTVSSTRRP